jgi:hypothetical protein
MRFAKLVTACLLTAGLLGACGITAKPIAGTAHVDSAAGSHAKVDDARARHVTCLRKHHLRVTEYRTPPPGRLPVIQVGTPPSGPTIVFYSTPGAAQYQQIEGNAQAAEVIGAALLYPNLASDHELTIVENCAALGVTG